MRRYAATAALLAATLALAGCTADKKPLAGKPHATASSGSPSSSPSTSPGTPPATPALPAGGTADEPALVVADRDLLDWSPVGGSTEATVTTNGDWSLTVDKSGSQADLEGPSSASGSGSSGERVTDAFLDDQWAVVVFEDKQETAPSRATVTDLATGKTFDIDGHSDVPTTVGGTWAMGEGHVLHATVHGQGYCVASVDLATRKSTLGWCAPQRHGFNGARITPAGDSLLTFDDSHPSCRTVVALDGTTTTPFEGVEDCHGWDGLVTDDGAVWSVVPQENNVETARFFARSGDAYYDLGPGSSGSLVWCAGSAYFARDPQQDGDPARLMRWTPGAGLDVVYESKGGQAFLAEPRCGGDTMTVTSLAQGGDEQVSTPLG
ncbi:hypothetical protein [Nocardioides sp. LS1]|uniref:hypothetical protein n=1 Tax=Nocardioides sp. LS1 TaxID=1027620 RepID=UPI000F61CD04|nr:hypothetical protein [Nocardioides sp. LS1]GCD90462.1 hypothetical protein NLS1_24680 [Nocardioides sp. LS1]